MLAKYNIIVKRTIRNKIIIPLKKRLNTIHGCNSIFMTENKPSIKHIVISGGGITGFSFYGALKESHEQGKWSIDNIQSIYGTSVGSILAVVLSLKYDWKTLDDYLIKRPWHNLYKFNLYSLMDAIQKRGIFNRKVIEDTVSPLFSGKDVSLDITMEELYARTGIDIHIFLTEIHSFTLVDISHTTHPQMKVIDAIYASSAVPIIFTPFLTENLCYCDGGMIANYPILQCINNGADPNEILGIVRIKDEKNDLTLSETSTLFDYAFIILRKSVEKIMDRPAPQKIHTEYVIESTQISLQNITNTASSMEERNRLIDIGKQYVIDYYSNELDELNL
jgi:predicted acylesterase/phospholipase RssA